MTQAPTRRTRSRLDRRSPLIGGFVIAIVFVLASVRELISPETSMHSLTLTDPRLLRPISLVINAIVQLTALAAIARVLDRRGWRPVAHVIATALLSLVIGTLCVLVVKLAIATPAPLRAALLAGPISGIQIYALWVLAFRYPQLADDARARAHEAERLRRTAELARLREHLQPHFLRNTLNAIAASVREDPDEARALLAALADLLTESIEQDEVTQSLAEETAWLRRYSEIFEVRHRGSLRFSWDLDPAAGATQLPRLLLQPLVENAIRHGALARGDGGEVAVQTRRTEAGVTVVVSDNGPGLDASRPEGLGLHLVRRRLAMECPDGRFHLASSPAGTRAVVELGGA